jgi:hypothetical protein
MHSDGRGHEPLLEDVRATSGDLGGIPVMFVDIADVEPGGTILRVHGGGLTAAAASIAHSHRSRSGSAAR